MRRALHLVVIAVGGLALSALPMSQAGALGGESLVCGISPGSAGTTGYCHATIGSSSYRVSFGVQNGSGTYSYSWTVTGGANQRVYSGCTATSSTCIVSVSGSSDQDIQGTVTLTQDGQSETLTATAYIPAWCGTGWC